MGAVLETFGSSWKVWFGYGLLAPAVEELLIAAGKSVAAAEFLFMLS